MQTPAPIPVWPWHADCLRVSPCATEGLGLLACWPIYVTYPRTVCWTPRIMHGSEVTVNLIYIYIYAWAIYTRQD